MLSKDDEKSEITILRKKNWEDITKVNTTQEELKGFIIIKTILRPKTATNQVPSRDTQSYFAVFIDDNN